MGALRSLLHTFQTKQHLKIRINKTMIVTRTSPFTGVTRSLDLNITAAQVARYKNGWLLQDAFPNLSAGDREFFKTGITDEEWKAQFGEE